MSERPISKITLEKYSHEVPIGIPCAIQNATNQLLTKRSTRISEITDWEELRQAGSDIRTHTLSHLDFYLQEFEKKATNAGVNVHWARDSVEASEMVMKIAQDHGVHKVVKSKSMATEELNLNSFLQEAGIETIETDLGEYIIQLAETGPSHIIVPAIHLSKEEIATLFSEKLNIQASSNPQELTQIARNVLREKFLSAQMGIVGSNFLIAETGTQVIVTNEGNGRMCTNLPNLIVTVVGIDKIIPDWKSLAVLLKLLIPSATGQKLTAYTSFITGPCKNVDPLDEKEYHIILLDNGRSRIINDPEGRNVLKCIRCGACMNSCPVYKTIGGFAYGWFIPGPIGAILVPQMLDTKIARELPYTSTLCGACVDACPVKVPITKILRYLRHRIAEGDDSESSTLPKYIRLIGGIVAWVFSNPKIYNKVSQILPIFNKFFRRDNWLNNMPYPISLWTDVRPLPVFRNYFRQWWRKSHE